MGAFFIFFVMFTITLVYSVIWNQYDNNDLDIHEVIDPRGVTKECYIPTNKNLNNRKHSD